MDFLASFKKVSRLLNFGWFVKVTDEKVRNIHLVIPASLRLSFNIDSMWCTHGKLSIINSHNVKYIYAAVLAAPVRRSEETFTSHSLSRIWNLFYCNFGESKIRKYQHTGYRRIGPPSPATRVCVKIFIFNNWNGKRENFPLPYKKFTFLLDARCWRFLLCFMSFSFGDSQVSEIEPFFVHNSHRRGEAKDTAAA